ncbi:type 2 GTP cyclohydrolase I [Rouxiella badensis]|uniref:type 2 GTP cyclohydrolase I n=1 Tax=Rouxiella badensis TaxID=1646377 RepID=UPI001B60EE8A|nr:type 2 GTP cyclohydrolase I [Rouxiella badensis]MCC3702331.1 type 2 GTP cyclohydrolase I [Rouxiella badensis]MCC3717337.1 type 2 GTP cyclohydrolase I [Rouxiella badensis]MCC3728433.1 type 2 GTP cyclohydrolase I [Rouxiella badensis]MCC3732337.1 type 2 GTP cyclohydrolase I [Rouxiella badensis]MCC3740177.1 type 2 GTP cyclohydrolase I [Rouxiella badensis]
MNNIVLEKIIDRKLDVNAFKDYAPNGLQVEGSSEVKRVVTGVTASQKLLDAAVAHGADTLIVHHGYFWKNEPAAVRGMKRNRLKTLLLNDINLYGYHLPLDAHPELGNNAQLANLFGIKVLGEIMPLVPYGELETPLAAEEFHQVIEQQLGRKVLHSAEGGPQTIRRIAWCSGGGQGFIQQAADFGVDAFISGEVSEQTIHIAREMGLHFFAAGHHASERYGVKALGEWLTAEHGLDVTFIDIDNPA